MLFGGEDSRIYRKAYRGGGGTGTSVLCASFFIRIVQWDLLKFSSLIGFLSFPMFGLMNRRVKNCSNFDYGEMNGIG